MLWNREDNVLLIFSIMSLPSSCIKRTKKQSRIGKTAAVAIGNGCCRVHIHWQILKPHRQWRCSRRVLDIVGGLEYKWRHQAELCKSVAVNMDDRVIPHICHRHHRRCLFKKKLPGVNFYRFKAKNWQFTVYFAVITQKIGNFLCISS